MHAKRQKPVRFARNALAIAIGASFPLAATLAEESKTLPSVQVQADAEEGYKANRSTSEKYTQPLLDTPKTIAVIPQTVMQDRSADSLRDALRNVPGISLAAGEGGTPTGDQLSIRGFDARNDIMIDNVRDIAGYTRDIYNVEAVEVAKGPGSAVYGRGSTGGSINLQTKTAKLDDFTDLSVRVGTESDYRLQADSNIKLGRTTALRINLLGDDGEVAGRDEVENSNYAGALSFATGLGTGSRLSINADYQNQDNLPDYGLPWVPNYSGVPTSVIADDLAAHEGGPPPVDYSNFYGNVFRDFEDIKAHSVTGKYEYDLSQSTMIRAVARIGGVERQSVVNAPRFTYEEVGGTRIYGEGNRISLAGEKTRDTEDSLRVVQLELIGQYKTGGITHDVVSGVELAEEKFERWDYDDGGTDNLDTGPETVDLFNPNARVAYTGNYSRGSKINEATGDTTAFFLFDTLTLSPKWQASLGLRYDIFETEYFYDLGGADPSVKIEAENKELSWNAGLVHKPVENGSIYLGVGTSFNPSAEDLTASTAATSNQNDLDPEESITYEVGTKWELMQGRLFTSAAIFRTDKKRARTDDPFDVGTSFETLRGEQRVQGIELTAAGQVTQALSLTVGYALQDSEVVRADGDDQVQEGQELARTPRHSISSWCRYDFSEKFAAGLGAQYISERYNSSDPAGREKADGYVVFDMMVSYQINPQWSAQINGSNLADEEYEDQLGGGHFIPGDGRLLTFSTRYSF